MSEQNSTNRKAKKAERDAARRLGGRKARKIAEDEVPNLPVGDDEDKVSAQHNTEEPRSTKSQPPSKKRKHAATEDDKNEADLKSEEKSSKPPKHKKARNTEGQDETEESTTPAQSKSRFIVFVGNLPYATTDSTLRVHFAKLQPFTLRHRTDPKTKRSKGFAFLEFENYDRMKTCLKLYHHSIFDPDDQANGGKGKGNGRGGRRINVELTAGGGGTTEGRKEKIRVKNQRLDEQRQRRAEQERKNEERTAKKGGGKMGANSEKAGGGDDDAANSGVHPSRLRQIGAA